MKRNKHILINLTEDQYNAINLIAKKTRRKIADVAFIMLTDSIEKIIINYIDEKNSGFKKMYFDPFNDYIK